MLTDDQTLSSHVKFLPLEYNIVRSLNVDVSFVSDLCVFWQQCLCLEAHCLWGCQWAQLHFRVCKGKGPFSLPSDYGQMSACAHTLTEAKAVPYALPFTEGTAAFELRFLNEIYGTLIPRTKINRQLRFTPGHIWLVHVTVTAAILS